MKLLLLAALLCADQFNLVDEALKKFSPKNMVTDEDLAKAFVFKTGQVQLFVLTYDAVVAGGLASEDILAVIKTNLKPLAKCYEDLLKKAAGIECALKAEFEIGPAGLVTSASVRDGAKCRPELNACVTDVVKAMKFPAPQGGQPVKVTYPFVFKPL